MAKAPDAVVREWFKEVWDEGREDAIDRLMAPTAQVHGLGGPGGAPMVGPAAFKQIFHTFRDALGDLEIAVERVVVQGDTCAAFCRVKGRHVGHAFGGPPTDRPVEFTGITIARTNGDQIVEGWNSFDFLSMYQQIGWVNNPPLP
jgi:predicted ester cyclase